MAAPTKTEIIEAFKGLPLSKLETLFNYSEHIIIPDNELLINVTMDQMRQKAISLAGVLFPEWTDFSATDFGTFIMELACLFSEKDFWYANAWANQVNLLRMSEYPAAFIRSIEYGYEARVYTAGTASFNVQFGAGSAVTYANGDLIIQMDDGATKFTNSAPIALSSSGTSTTMGLTLRQGDYRKETFAFNGRSIVLRIPKIDPALIEVTFDGVSWARVQNFGNSSAGSTHFMVVPDVDGRCTIYFGNNTYGKAPNVTQVAEVKYLVTDATNIALTGDGTAGAVAKSNSTRAAIDFAMTARCLGGLLASTLDELTTDTLNFFTTKFACSNNIMVKKWLLQNPEILRASVTYNNSTNVVTYRITQRANKNGEPPTGFTDDLTLQLNGLVSNGFSVAYATTTRKDLSPMTIDILARRADPVTNPNPMTVADVPSIVQAIVDYTDPEVFNDYGTGFNRSVVNLYLQKIFPGLASVTFTLITALPGADVSCTTDEMTMCINPGLINIAGFNYV